MPISLNRASASPRSSGLTALLGPSAPHLVTFTICLLLLLYGYEIFNFSLSIDEEVYQQQNALWASVAQGRWAIGLLHRLFPPMGSIPMLATVLFCCGLGVSAYVLARVLFRSHAAQWAFAGILVASPVWPHIAQFNPLSWAVGVSCILLTIIFLLTFSESRFNVVLAAGLMAVAIGIYQTFLMWYLVLICIRLLSVLIGTAPADPTGAQARFPWLRTGLIAGGGVLTYVAIEVLFLTVFSVKLAYIQEFVRVGEFTRTPAHAIYYTLRRTWDLALGGDPIYLGYGYFLVLLPVLGFLIVAVRLLWGSESVRLPQRLWGGASLVAAVLLGISPILVAAGAIPPRTVIPWIPVNAFLAGIAFAYRTRLDKLLYVTLAAALFVSIWISVSFFYTDHLARQRDEFLSARIMARVDQLVPDPPSSRIPFVVVSAAPPTPDIESFHEVEVFGASFYDWDLNPVRVAAYLRTLGVDTLEPRGIADIEPYRAAIEALPVWPAAGSVALVNGILVIKLGPMPLALAPKPTISAPKLTPKEVTASQTAPGQEPTLAVDGDVNTWWAAGAFAPQWVQFDLGEPSTVSRMLLRPAQLPDGHTTHQIYGGPSPDNLKLLGTADRVTQAGQWLEVPITGSDVRYLRVVTIKSPSFIAWVEVEIYK